jgi:IS30 family transposase
MLRLAEREEISRGIAAGWSMRRIAQGLGRSPSTVSREIRRNGGYTTYRANEADTQRGSNENTNGLLRQYFP